MRSWRGDALADRCSRIFFEEITVDVINLRVERAFEMQPVPGQCPWTFERERARRISRIVEDPADVEERQVLAIRLRVHAHAYVADDRIDVCEFEFGAVAVIVLQGFE